MFLFFVSIFLLLCRSLIDCQAPFGAASLQRCISYHSLTIGELALFDIHSLSRHTIIVSRQLCAHCLLFSRFIQYLLFPTVYIYISILDRRATTNCWFSPFVSRSEKSNKIGCCCCCCCLFTLTHFVYLSSRHSFVPVLSGQGTRPRE